MLLWILAIAAHATSLSYLDHLPKADVVVVSATSTTVCDRYELLEGRWRCAVVPRSVIRVVVRNQGTASTPASTPYSWYPDSFVVDLFTANPVWFTRGQQRRSIPQLDPGESYTVDFAGHAGHYWVIADYEDDVSESDEGNNELYVP